MWVVYLLGCVIEVEDIVKVYKERVIYWFGENFFFGVGRMYCVFEEFGVVGI